MSHVYLFRAGADHYKVGVANNVRKRLKAIQTGNPVRVQLVTAKLVDNAYAVELDLHLMLSEMRSDGGTEWFRLTPDQALEIAIRINERPDVEDDTTRVNKVFEHYERVIDKKVTEALERIGPKIKRTQVHKEQSLSTPDADELLIARAMEVFEIERKASTSLLQRRLHIGYGRAARVVDELERRGLVGESDGLHARRLIGTHKQSRPDYAITLGI